MEQGIKVRLLEKRKDGSLYTVDERRWSMDMVASLHHINYLTVAGQEYETVEGRLDVETGTLELLLIAVQERASITRG